MGKHEPMTAKAIANKIKAKGLQKIKYYCEMCKKQCRDDNGFKCHIMSESHQRQALIVSENPEKFVGEFSKQFMDGFMYILKARYRTKKVLANTVFQDYIKERDHIHMNGTRWTSLTEFAKWLGENGYVEVADSERGVLITYIDNDPETLRRRELEAKRAQQTKEAAAKAQKEIERQREATNEVYKRLEAEKPKAEPVPIEKIAVTKDVQSDEEVVILNSSSELGTNDGGVRVDPAGASSDQKKPSDGESCDIIERPVFKIQPVVIKGPTSSGYKPPAPKRKIVKSGSLGSKRPKTS